MSLREEVLDTFLSKGRGALVPLPFFVLAVPEAETIPRADWPGRAAAAPALLLLPGMDVYAPFRCG